MQKSKQKSGSGLIFAVMLLFVILGMVITLSSITVLETRMNQKTKSSVGAFYNSESGVEWVLNQIATNPATNSISTLGTVDGKAVKCPVAFGTDTCKIYFLDQTGNVLAPTALLEEVKAVRSVGSKGEDTQRAIEAAVAASGDYQLQCWNSGTYDKCCRFNTSNGKTECEGSYNGNEWQPLEHGGPWD